jgi:hypothetical protein
MPILRTVKIHLSWINSLINLEPRSLNKQIFRSEVYRSVDIVEYRLDNKKYYPNALGLITDNASKWYKNNSFICKKI